MRRITLSGAVLLAVLGIATPAISYAGLDLTLDVSLGTPVDVAPPPLPVYVVPAPPQDNVVWMPGFWDWDEDYGDYYWVPGTWVQPPAVNVVWTPGYWGWSDGRYYFHRGYWGPHVGFYGGVNYGGGYDGHGFHGGEWRDQHYVVNRSVVNVRNVTNVTNIVSYNGGPGGIGARPTAAQAQAQREHHFAPTSNQVAHMREAGSDHALYFDNNHGRPAVVATPRPVHFQHAQPAAPQPQVAPRPENPVPQMRGPIRHDEPRQMQRPTQPVEPQAPRVAEPPRPQMPQQVEPQRMEQPRIEQPRAEQPRDELPHPQAMPDMHREQQRGPEQRGSEQHGGEPHGGPGSPGEGRPQGDEPRGGDGGPHDAPHNDGHP